MKNNIHVNQLIYIYKSLINIIPEKIGQLPPKKGKGELSLCCGKREQVIPIYSQDTVSKLTGVRQEVNVVRTRVIPILYLGSETMGRQ